MKKAYMYFPLTVLQALFFSACDLFHTSLAEYLYEISPVSALPPVPEPVIPSKLRMTALFVTYNGTRYEPIEPLSASRSHYTICAAPVSKTDAAGSVALDAVPLEVSSTAIVDIPSWTIPDRALSIQSGDLPVPFDSVRFQIYRPDETRTVTLTAVDGTSKTYTVSIIWAQLVDTQAKFNLIRNNLYQDYYLKRGLSLVLDDWLPIGANSGYSAYTVFTGSLRGNGNTIQINSLNVPVSAVEFQGLFAEISHSVVEDLHVRLNGVSTKARHAGGVAGTIYESLIRRVRVSGDISNEYTLIDTANTGGIAGTINTAMIRDSAAAAHVKGTFGSGGSVNDFRLGGVAGNQVYTHGGFIINTYASGNVINDSPSNPATAGGITGGGGYSNIHAPPDTEIRGCVALNPVITVGTGGDVDYILGQWDGPITLAINNANCYTAVNLSGATPGTATPASITGTLLTSGAEHLQSTYTGLGWDFINVWKMSAVDHLPALYWE
jgi:hypothetical protein